jgi:type I restriction enzyme S subunit
MSEWKEYKLGEISKVKGGKRLPKGNNLTSTPNSHPYIRVRDMGEKYLPINNLEYVPNELFSSIQNYIVDKGDLILSIVGTVGLVSIVNEKLDKASLTENCVKIIPQKDILNNEFLYYYLKSNFGQAEINKKIVGAVQPKLPIYNINDIDIKLPDLKTQSDIAEILSSLDDKIEINNKINQELETLAQLLFKQWFIDFEFPNENGEPYKSSGGEMIDSELGVIPNQWSIVILSEVTKLIKGISYRKPELVSKDEGIAFVNLKCFSINGTFRQDGIKYYNGKYKKEQILSNNDILVAVTDLTQDREIIGMPILWNGNQIALPSLDTCIIRSESIELKNFLYYEFKTKRYKSRIIEHANGSTVLHLSVKGLETYVFALPNDRILKNWSKVIQPILETINSNIKEINELKNLRDTLLPKLISGELQINDN